MIVLIAGIFAYWYFGSTNYLLTGVPVLNYHQVNNKYQTVLTMKPENFDEQMKYLHDNDYHSITQEEFDAYMSGDGDLPDRPVMITFDDGYIDNYKEAYPILKKYGFTATIFVITDLVGKPGYLTWPMIQEMAADGVMEETKKAGYKYAFSVETGRDFPWDDHYELDRVPMFEGPISFKHFKFRLTFSAFSALVWKSHKYFENIECTKSIAKEIPYP